MLGRYPRGPFGLHGSTLATLSTMEKSTILIVLTLATLLTGMAIAAYQLWSTARAKRQGEHTDGSKDRPNA